MLQACNLHRYAMRTTDTATALPQVVHCIDLTVDVTVHIHGNIHYATPVGDLTAGTRT